MDASIETLFFLLAPLLFSSLLQQQHPLPLTAAAAVGTVQSVNVHPYLVLFDTVVVLVVISYHHSLEIFVVYFYYYYYYSVLQYIFFSAKKASSLENILTIKS